MAASTSKETRKEATGDGQLEGVALWSPPKGAGFQSLEDLQYEDDIVVIVGWGPEGTGKTMFFLRNMPLPLMILNLDRPITKGHMGWKGMKERLPGIFVLNLREKFEELDVETALGIRTAIENAVTQNLQWLKGGTLLIDGATTLRDILKLADPKIGPKVEKGQRFNPKDKANVNAYMAAFIANIQDKGINLCFTGHSANSWEMKSVMGDDGPRNQLTRTNRLYPKMDDILFERCTTSLLFFKRCECGRNITTQDGTCDAITDSLKDKAGAMDGHVGRKHMVRFVTNKMQTAVEGSEYEDLDWDLFQVLTGADTDRAVKMMKAMAS